MVANFLKTTNTQSLRVTTRTTRCTRTSRSKKRSRQNILKKEHIHIHGFLPVVLKSNTLSFYNNLIN